MKSAIKDDNPVLFYEHKLLYKSIDDVPVESYDIPLGKADIKRAGQDATVVATGSMVHVALQAAKQLEKAEINVEVIDPRTLVPLDEQTIIHSVQKTNRLIVVHEAVKRGDRKSTRLNSSHVAISYAVFCLKKKNKTNQINFGLRKLNLPLGIRRDCDRASVGPGREPGQPGRDPAHRDR